MRIEATEKAEAVVERAVEARTGTLTITIGTGCCESTAPFLYEDFWPGPDQAEIGVVAGVPVLAPAYLRDLYPDDELVVIDLFEGPAESLSIETEWDCRLYLRGEAVDAGEATACRTPVADDGPGLLAERRVGTFVTGELPEQLRNVRMR